MFRSQRKCVPEQVPIRSFSATAYGIAGPYWIINGTRESILFDPASERSYTDKLFCSESNNETIPSSQKTKIANKTSQTLRKTRQLVDFHIKGNTENLGFAVIPLNYDLMLRKN